MEPGQLERIVKNLQSRNANTFHRAVRKLVEELGYWATKSSYELYGATQKASFDTIDDLKEAATKTSHRYATRTETYVFGRKKAIHVRTYYKTIEHLGQSAHRTGIVAASWDLGLDKKVVYLGHLLRRKDKLANSLLGVFEKDCIVKLTDKSRKTKGYYLIDPSYLVQLVGSIQNNEEIKL